ncbi:MAG: hypothetical protein HYY22_02075 [Thaumarchaeota archaeon]|nr:hypothetical protein [Nitrososphaerota archaeon]
MNDKEIYAEAYKAIKEMFLNEGYDLLTLRPIDSTKWELVYKRAPDMIVTVPIRPIDEQNIERILKLALSVSSVDETIAKLRYDSTRVP